MLNFLFRLTGLYGCEPLEGIDHLHASIVAGQMNENQTYNDGTVFRVSCVHGFELNMANDSVKCKNGAWKPKWPLCNACKSLSNPSDY